MWAWGYGKCRLELLGAIILPSSTCTAMQRDGWSPVKSDVMMFSTSPGYGERAIGVLHDSTVGSNISNTKRFCFQLSSNEHCSIVAHLLFNLHNNCVQNEVRFDESLLWSERREWYRMSKMILTRYRSLLSSPSQGYVHGESFELLS